VFSASGPGLVAVCGLDITCRHRSGNGYEGFDPTYMFMQRATGLPLQGSTRPGERIRSSATLRLIGLDPQWCRGWAGLVSRSPASGVTAKRPRT